jgi:hypothetical protein
LTAVLHVDNIAVPDSHSSKRASEQSMSEKRTWIWERLRKKNRRELDRLASDLIRRPGEKRKFAGDPNQARFLWIRTRNK